MKTTNMVTVITVIMVITVITVIMDTIITTITTTTTPKHYRHVDTTLRSTLLTLVWCSIRLGVVTSKLSRTSVIHFDMLVCGNATCNDPPKKVCFWIKVTRLGPVVTRSAPVDTDCGMQDCV